MKSDTSDHTGVDKPTHVLTLPEDPRAPGSSRLGRESSKALRNAISPNQVSQGSAGQRILYRLKALFAWMKGKTNPIRDHYDKEYLKKQRFQGLTTGESIDGNFLVRCDICGKLFTEMPSALDHLQGHERHFSENITPRPSVSGEHEGILEKLEGRR